MSDPRVTPDPALAVRSGPAQIVVPLTDLCRSPAGPRDRQLIFGETVTILGDRDGWIYLRADKDGYCGFVRGETVGSVVQATHRVSAAATHAYTAPDLKSPDRASLSFGSRITVTGQTGKFGQTTLGHIPMIHLSPIDALETEPCDVAARFLGTPYLWGGNSRWGIDCSGLVQAALLACGIPCPGDSDQQLTLGQPADGPCRRNDLLFWKGHVALVADAATLIHANAGSMSTTYEDLSAAIARIDAAGDGPVTAHRRLFPQSQKPRSEPDRLESQCRT